MPSNRREYNKQETVRHIRSVFMSLYAQLGINGITVSQLCKACGIAKSTFYLYFDDKFAVLESAEEEILTGLRSINPTLDDCDMEVVRTGRPLPNALETVQFLKAHADTLRALLGNQGDPRFVLKWKRDIEASFINRFLTEKGSARSASLACTVFSSALVGLYTHYLFVLPDISEQELSIILGNLLHYSLFDFQSLSD